MTEGYLLARKLLRLQGPGLALESKSPGDLSAIAWADTAAGRVLWLGGDEAFGIGASAEAAKVATCRNAILTLRDDGSGTFLLNAVTRLRELLPQVPLVLDKKDDEEEIDIEGLDLEGNHLWLVGSHSTKRKKPDAGDRDGRRLRKVEHEQNRYLLARLTVEDGAIVTAAGADGTPMSSALTWENGESPLMQALSDDPHLAPFVRPMAAAPGEEPLPLPGKDNGFDIEGLAVRQGRVYLGLRGPVLRGWAIILALEPKAADAPGTLRLSKVGKGGPRVIKHFLWLGGMGIRDLIFDGDDLLILAGPTMDIDGIAAVWRLQRPDELADGSLTGRPPGEDRFDADRLHRLFDLPTKVGRDRAEGMIRFDQWGEQAVMIVYDAADDDRHLRRDGAVAVDAVFADVFRLPKR